MTLTIECHGRTITTIEGLADKRTGKLDSIQEAFIDHTAFQCGYCTPGMIMKAHSLLSESPEPSRDEIIEEMDENLCRCGSHVRIIEAIETATKEMKGGA